MSGNQLSDSANRPDVIEELWEASTLPLFVSARLSRAERCVAAAAGVAKLLRSDTLLAAQRQDDPENDYRPLGGFITDQLQTAVLELCWSAWESLSGVRDTEQPQPVGAPGGSE